MKNLDLLIPQAQPEPDKFAWATVTSIDPVRVRLDGETTPLDITPDCLVDVGWLDVDRRVWCQIHGRRVLILGQSGKPASVPVDPDSHTYSSAAGWIASEAAGWKLWGDGRAQVRTPQAANEAANKAYVDTVNSADYSTYYKTTSYSVANGSTYMPARDSGDDSGAVVWDNTNKFFRVSKAGVYVVTATVPWPSFGNVYRRDLFIQRSRDGGASWDELAQSGTTTSGYLALNASAVVVVTQAEIDAVTIWTGVLFRFRNFQNTGSTTTITSTNTGMQVARIA